ncbi:dynein light chain Tctex-type 5-like [Montipora foliosa]|uniref:dynein light chain Tctex-type 5-like n=1 Tax=Montipora foliosa TaxID=591990 RepID=UPI0035F1CCBB
MTPRKRAFENTVVSTLIDKRCFVKDELLVLQPACKLQDLKIQDIIEEVLRTNLKEVCFESWDSDARCNALSQMIRQKLRGTEHKFVNVAVVVLIGQADDTGIVKASHKVWKPEYDSFASAWFKNETLFAVGTVFATYAARNS